MRFVWLLSDCFHSQVRRVLEDKIHDWKWNCDCRHWLLFFRYCFHGTNSEEQRRLELLYHEILWRSLPSTVTHWCTPGPSESGLARRFFAWDHFCRRTLRKSRSPSSSSTAPMTKSPTQQDHKTFTRKHPLSRKAFRYTRACCTTFCLSWRRIWSPGISFDGWTACSNIRRESFAFIPPPNS